MRLLKLLGVAAVLIGITLAYVIITAIHAGDWLDREFAELSKGWDAHVIVRDARYSSAQGDLASLQAAFDNLKQAHLQAVEPAACTYGMQLGSEDDDNGMRAQCVVVARFEGGVVQFHFELVRGGSGWQIAQFAIQPDEQ